MKHHGNLLVKGEDLWIPQHEYEELKRKAELYDQMMKDKS